MQQHAVMGLSRKMSNITQMIHPLNVAGRDFISQIKVQTFIYRLFSHAGLC